MNWVLGLVGALLGAGLAESEGFFGALTGFLVVYLLASLSGLRKQVSELARELAASNSIIALLRQRPADVVRDEAAAAPIQRQAGIRPADASVAEFASRQSAQEAVVDARPQGSVGTDEPAAPAAQRPAPQVNQPPPVARPTAPPKPREPSWVETFALRVKSWFTEGNVPVKIGVLVLLFGVAAALRYAAAEGYFVLSIEARLAVIAGAALAALAWGWRERERKPAFGLSVQGGALGALLLTVFAAFRMYGLLPPALAFALIVVLVSGAAMLAVLQRNMALAVLGFLGGYLAPVLISTGSGNHIALFSYYAVLNAAVFAISWRQNWRLLNLIGFLFTFGVGAAWGERFYRPELFATVEPFLILFFVFYIVIGLLYVIRQAEHRKPWVDGTLVFGTPLVAFPLQAAMLKDDRLGMAFSALVVALVYMGLVYWLRRRRGEQLLTEAYAALALGFATLAIPLAFSASTTASVWALEGAGVAWLGLRQGRRIPWLAGLALQLLGAGAYCFSLIDGDSRAMPGDLLLLNAPWLGAAILAFSGFTLALIHDRHKPRFRLPALLFSWAAFWWLVAGATQLQLADSGLGAWQFTTLYGAITVALAAVLREKLPWPRLNWLIALGAVAGVLLVIAAEDQFDGPLASPTWLSWAAWLAAMGWALWSAAATHARSMVLAHVLTLWTILLACSWHAGYLATLNQLASGWQFLAMTTPLFLLTAGLWKRPGAFAWPRAVQFVTSYRLGWFGLALPLVGLAWVSGLFMDGRADPLPFIPIINPLELGLLALGLLLYGLCGSFEGLRPLRRAWPLLAFAFVTMATLRAVHHLHGEPWAASLLNSGFSQASLTVVWSLLGVAAWILGSRRSNRQVWIGGAVLMSIVLLKLLLVDRTYMGNMPGIVSFMAVGLLLVVVGYLAPSPPRVAGSGETA